MGLPERCVALIADQEVVVMADQERGAISEEDAVDEISDFWGPNGDHCTARKSPSNGLEQRQNRVWLHHGVDRAHEQRSWFSCETDGESEPLALCGGQCIPDVPHGSLEE